MWQSQKIVQCIPSDKTEIASALPRNDKRETLFAMTRGLLSIYLPCLHFLFFTIRYSLNAIRCLFGSNTFSLYRI